MSDDPTVAQAEAEAERAKQRLLATITTLKARLAPGALARDAGQKVRQAGENAARSGADAARRHPLPVIGVVAAIGAFVARKPLLRLLRRKKSTESLD